MEHCRRTAHTRFDIKFHLVWITRYRKELLRADVGVRLRQLVRDICSVLEAETSNDHSIKYYILIFEYFRIGELLDAADQWYAAEEVIT
ncbi:MAG: hypothetical protein ABS79_05545 [Planctomycetes bacterium SCN 63-9]|nr:MAG: hypothetical protein ABS79_05545 [Planctomycetes bacterium SCN 63-9]